MSELKEIMNITELHKKGFTDHIMIEACRELVLRGLEVVAKDTSKRDVIRAQARDLCRVLYESSDWNGIRAVIKRRL